MCLEESIRWACQGIFFSRFPHGKSNFSPTRTSNPINFGFFFARFCPSRGRFHLKKYRYGKKYGRFGLFWGRFDRSKTYFLPWNHLFRSKPSQFSTPNRPEISLNRLKKNLNRSQIDSNFTFFYPFFTWNLPHFYRNQPKKNPNRPKKNLYQGEMYRPFRKNMLNLSNRGHCGT